MRNILEKSSVEILDIADRTSETSNLVVSYGECLFTDIYKFKGSLIERIVTIYIYICKKFRTLHEATLVTLDVLCFL